MDAVGKKALKAGTWYTICTFVLKGLAFITMPIFARIMSMEDVGTYSNYISWIAILTSIFTLDLYTSVNLAHFEYDDKIYPFMSTITIAGTAVTAVVYAISCIFTDQVTDWLGISPYMMHIMFIYLLVHPAVNILHVKFRVYLQYRYTIITSLIPAILSVLVALALVGIVPDEMQLNARVIGYYGVWILASLAVYIYIIFRGRTFKMEYVKFAIPIALPMVLHLLSQTLLSSSDRVMIKQFCGEKDTALYATAYSCAMMVSILWNEEKDIWKVAKPIILIFSGGILLMTLMAPELLLVMGGRKYKAAVYVIPPVMLGYIAQMLYTMYVNIEFYHKKQKQIMKGTMAAALLNIILNLIFIPLFGYVAAAYTTLAGYIALLFFHYLFVRKMGLHGILRMRFCLMVLVGSIVAGIAMIPLYDLAILRWTVIGGIGVFVIIFLWKRRGTLKQQLKKKDIEGILKTCKLM